jgi:hypothetical protein
MSVALLSDLKRVPGMSYLAAGRALARGIELSTFTLLTLSREWGDVEHLAAR